MINRPWVLQTQLYSESLAPKPGTSVYADERQGYSDELHIAIVDDNGDLTGVKGNID